MLHLEINPYPNKTTFFHITSVADPDPGLGAFLTPGSGMGESQYSDTGSAMDNPDHIF